MRGNMGKLANFLLGAALGAGVGVVFNYLFGPAQGTEFTQNYRSRWSKALDDGQQAADEREAELRRQFAEAKQPKP
jgi:gas vesicle protein